MTDRDRANRPTAAEVRALLHGRQAASAPHPMTRSDRPVSVSVSLAESVGLAGCG